MPLDIKSQSEFVTDEIAAINAALPGVYQFPLGSIVRALVEAHGRIALWEESLIEQVLSEIRLATSTGTAANSFVGDFGLIRLPAVSAHGDVTFSSTVTTSQRVVHIGDTVSIPNGTVSYAVTIDASNPDYDPTENGYVMAIGIADVTVPVEAATAGIIGNVQAGKITIINSPITGVDNVTNAIGFENGEDAQTDPELRAYFVQYINSLSRATEDAVGFAVESASFGDERVIDFIIVENTNYSTLAEQLGYFFVVIDDGTGTPSQDLIDAVIANVELYRGLAIRFDVFAPIPITVNISATVTLPSGYPSTGMQDAIEATLLTYIKSVPFGGTIDYTRVGREIYDGIASTLADRTVLNQINVSTILVNGGTVDLTSTVKQKFIQGTTIITFN